MFNNQRGAIQLLVVLILLGGIAAGVYLVIEGPKIFKPEAESSIEASYNNTGISSIKWKGTELLTGTGYYIIGSCTGDDVPGENVVSVPSDGKTLHAPGSCPGAPYSLTITGNNPYHVSIKIGPLPADYNALSVPMDPVKQHFNRFTFSHSGYRVGCSGTWEDRSGNSDFFSSIFTPCFIEGPGGGPVGVAQVISAEPGSWIEANGQIATIRRTLISSNAKNTGAVNHPGSSGIGFGFDIEPPYHQILPKGSSYFLEEEILITDPTDPASVSGLSSAGIGNQVTYTAKLSGGYISGEIHVTKGDGLSPWSCNKDKPNSKGEYWCKITTGNAPSFSGSFTFTEAGEYRVAVNGYQYDVNNPSNVYDPKKVCSGNPFGRYDSDPNKGWVDCGSQDNIIVNVSSADVSPTGSFDSISCTNFSGIGQDNNAPNAVMQIDFHLISTNSNNTDLSKNYYLGAGWTDPSTKKFTFNPQLIGTSNFGSDAGAKEAFFAGKNRDVSAYVLNVDSSGNRSGGASSSVYVKTISCSLSNTVVVPTPSATPTYQTPPYQYPTPVYPTPAYPTPAYSTPAYSTPTYSTPYSTPSTPSPSPCPGGVVGFFTDLIFNCPTPAPTSTPQAALVAGSGDGNNDGKIDLVDLSIFFSNFAKTENVNRAVDLNSDGVINAVDFSLMRNLLIEKGVIKG